MGCHIVSNSVRGTREANVNIEEAAKNSPIAGQEGDLIATGTWSTTRQFWLIVNKMSVATEAR
jgi:hypothetical protein